MKKGITFGKNDEKLIKDILKFQHQNQITSFTEAVRQLCQLALKYEKVRTKED